jgi:mannose-6-phosphate isomerase
MRAYKLENTVQNYAWGSTEGLKDCLGIPNPEGKPVAELWIGAHPKAPSLAVLGKGRQRLDEMIQAEAEACLGPSTVGRFGPALPFLLKALSAGGPLSIQAHPSKRKAEKGYERENLAGIPLDAPERNYRDRNHKPEMVVALTRFEGLFGFRPIAEIIENIKLLAPDNFQRYIGRLEKNPGRVELSVLFYSVISSDQGSKSEILGRVLERLPGLLARTDLEPSRLEALRWMERLRHIYPGDVGILAPALMNYMVLEPGEGLFVGAGELHAYLKGEALELMASSDNVIRGALTGKHVDVPELISVLSFDSGSPLPFRARPGLPGEEDFPVLTPDFRLSLLSPKGGILKREAHGPELLLCASGTASFRNGGESFDLAQGEAAFIRADAGAWSLEGEARVWRAFMPEAEGGL